MWSDDEREQVRGLLVRFCDADEVCAVMECGKGELDGLCADAFGVDYATAEARFHAQGRALLRKAQFDLALAGNGNVLQQLGREYLGQESASYRPKERREQPKEQEPTELRGGALRLLQSKYPASKAVGM